MEDQKKIEAHKKKKVFEWRVCKDCKKDFFISVAEKEFYDSRKDEYGNTLVLPKRCFWCREGNKNKK